MNGIVILVGVLQGHDVRMLRQVAHDLHLPPHVLDVDRRPKLLLRDRLARQLLSGPLVRTEVGYAELAPAQLTAQLVAGLDLAARRGLQNGELRPVRGGGVETVVDREGVFLFSLFALLVRRFVRGRRGAAVSHVRGATRLRRSEKNGRKYFLSFLPPKKRDEIKLN